MHHRVILVIHIIQLLLAHIMVFHVSLLDSCIILFLDHDDVASHIGFWIFHLLLYCHLLVARQLMLGASPTRKALRILLLIWFIAILVNVKTVSTCNPNDGWTIARHVWPLPEGSDGPCGLDVTLMIVH